MIVGLPANRSAKLKVCLWIGLDVSAALMELSVSYARMTAKPECKEWPLYHSVVA